MDSVSVSYALLVPCGLGLSYALIFTLLRTPLASLYADSPDGRKVHLRPVSRIGGTGLVLSALAGVLAVQNLLSTPLPGIPGAILGTLVFGGLFLIAAGGLDDLYSLSFRIKFPLQFFAASVAVFAFGIHFETLHIHQYSLQLGYWGLILSVFWIVGIMNALNIVDGIDGLAPSVSIIGFATVAVLANSGGALGLVVLGAILIGVTMGFLLHNLWGPRKTFLGDTGSLFLGFVLAVLSIQVTRLPQSEFSFLVPVLVLGYPVFDVLVAMVRRFCKRMERSKRRISLRVVNMFHADNEHLHHRLVQWGLSHLQTTFLLSMVAATMGVVAVLISRLSLPYQMAVFGYLVAGLMLILNRMGYIGSRNWVTFPRPKVNQSSVVGVLDPEEVFLYSLQTYQQSRLEFLNMPRNISTHFANQFSAMVVKNRSGERFQDDLNTALRTAEVHDCPVFFIADAVRLWEVRNNEVRKFDSLHFVAEPVRIPDLVEHITGALGGREKRGKFPGLEAALDKNLKHLVRNA